MAVYLLDTNAISDAVRNPTGSVAIQIDRHRPEIVTSAIVECELRSGIASKPESRVAARIGQFLDSLDILPFSSNATGHYGDIRAHLKTRGRPIGLMDTLIAAHCRSLDACLVTHNVSDFTGIADLQVEDPLPKP